MPSRVACWVGVHVGAIMVIASTLAGCASVKEFISARGPDVRVVGLRVTDVTIHSATLRFVLEVENPYSVALPVAEVDYSLATGEQRFLSGRTDVHGSIPPRESTTIEVPATIRFKELLATVKSIRPGVIVPYTADFGVSVKAPGAGPLRLAMGKSGQFPVPSVPKVTVRRIRWDRISLDEAGGTVMVDMVNHNAFRLALTKLDYTLSLGGTVVAQSAIDHAVECAADGGEATVAIPITFSPTRLGMAIFRIISGSGSGYRLQGALKVTTPFGPMMLPVDVSGETVFGR